MSKNKQKSSVDELWDYLKGWIPQGQYAGVREAYLEAKAMHKEEQGKTWDAAIENMKARGGNDMRAWADFDDYYNESFGGNDEK